MSHTKVTRTFLLTCTALRDQSCYSIQQAHLQTTKLGCCKRRCFSRGGSIGGG